ncbi:hypothetical protein [Streptomyces tanashiensis]|uniref:Uncharacterized protein n=1 Tax=Streptomyces tanashiensis TaxID=67367 RepID=A0ABY6R317_9ACTN|nr:hypothetical protein [Streptomyces tanashiensis]UZX23977.1 hypothetical protein LDH80_26165 [Streptomyces tanashiensis]
MTFPSLILLIVEGNVAIRPAAARGNKRPYVKHGRKRLRAGPENVSPDRP